MGTTSRRCAISQRADCAQALPFKGRVGWGWWRDSLAAHDRRASDDFEQDQEVHIQGQTNQRILAAKLQRRLRSAPTHAESILWRRLRLRQLENCKFRRQHPFGSYILDFACLERKIVVEVDGSQHFDSEKYDTARDEFLERAGFLVLRFWNSDVLANAEGVLEVILRALRSREKPSPPNPPREGEG